MEKRTQKILFGEILALGDIQTNVEYKAFIEKQIEKLERKSTTRVPTATQKENISIKETIIKGLATVGIAVTITELQEQVEELQKYSNQKLSALLKQLVEQGEVVNTKDKKKSLFALAD